MSETASDHDSSPGDVSRLSRLLVDAEQRAAAVPELEERIEQLERSLLAARRETDAARRETVLIDARLTGSEQVLADVIGSPSWQATRPLRVAKRLLRERGT